MPHSLLLRLFDLDIDCDLCEMLKYFSSHLLWGRFDIEVLSLVQLRTNSSDLEFETHFVS